MTFFSNKRGDLARPPRLVPRLILVLGFLCGVAGTAGPAFGQTEEVQTEEEQPQIAVWNFNLTEMTESDGQAIANRLRSSLVNTHVFKVMTRDQIETLLGEQALGQTLIDAKEAIRAGKLKGVKYVVTGSLIAIRGAYQGTFEMIDGKTGEIVSSITPRTFRGDFLDFLDIEVPKIAVRLAGVESSARAAPVAVAPAAPLPAAPPPGGARTTLYVAPGSFKGNGARSLEKDNPKLVKYLKNVLDKELPAFKVIQPFAEEDLDNPEVEKLRRKNLRSTIWRGTLGFGFAKAQPNENYLKVLAKAAKLDLVLLIQTESAFLSGGDHGSFTMTLYNPGTSVKFTHDGEWKRRQWRKDMGEGMKILLAQHTAKNQPPK